MPVEKDSEVYNMNHRRRGIALLFNHMNFDHRLGLKARNGTDKDRDNLRMTLRQLDFEVRFQFPYFHFSGISVKCLSIDNDSSQFHEFFLCSI